MEEKKMSSHAFPWAYTRYIAGDSREVALYHEK